MKSKINATVIEAVKPPKKSVKKTSDKQEVLPVSLPVVSASPVPTLSLPAKEPEPVLFISSDEDLEIGKVSKEEIKQAALFSREQARGLVDLYYVVQKNRIRANNKQSACKRKMDVEGSDYEPSLIANIKGDMTKTEKKIIKGLKAFAESQTLGRWCMSNYGVGPVCTAGFLAHIDLTVARTAGSVWRFAGLLPPEYQTWEKSQKRPYNAQLKCLCWKLGQCFLKFHNEPECFYGRLYKQRKEREIYYNETGRFKERAKMRLDKAMRGNYRISPEQKEIWKSGKLQPVGLDLRATRYAVRMFISHYFEIGRKLLDLPVPKPFAFGMLKHEESHYIPPPNWPMR